MRWIEDPATLATNPIDVPAIASPVWRESAAGRSGNRWRRQKSSRIAIVILLLVASVACVIGSRPIYLGLDSIGHYVQVWFLHQSIDIGHDFPVTNPYLQGGHARAFPYGLVPYLMATFLYDVLGDRAVSILMAGVAFFLVFIVWCTRLSRNLILTACFASSLPFLDGLMSFQFVFFWSALFFFLFAWAMENGRWVPASVLMWATMVTHPIIGLEAVAIFSVWFVRSQRKQVRVYLWTSLPALVFAAPAYIHAFGDPSVAEASKVYLAAKVLIRSVFGLSIMFGPFLLYRFRHHLLRFPARALMATCLSSVVWFGAGGSSWTGLIQEPQQDYAEYFQSGCFRPGAIYRVLEPADEEEGQYYFVQNGGILVNSFFTATMFRKDWDSEAEYRAFLDREQVDYVVIEVEYRDDFKTNEYDLLVGMVRSGRSSITFDDPAGRFTVFDVEAPLDVALGPVDRDSPGHPRI